MEGTVRRPDPGTEFSTAEQCHILESWNEPGDQGGSIARARVEAGITTQLHRLRGVTERYVIIEGTGTMRVGGSEPADVGPGDVVFIPAGTAQQITNTGEGDLLFYCFCTPRFTPDCYEPME